MYHVRCEIVQNDGSKLPAILMLKSLDVLLPDNDGGGDTVQELLVVDGMVLAR